MLEFAGYKLGLSPAKDLPWEFAAQCRTSVQPFVAYCLCKLLLTLGWYNPIIAAFLLRLGSGVLAWWVITRIVVRLLPRFSTETGRKLFVVASFFLWFVPYLAVRFSAENLSASLFFLAVTMLMDVQSTPNSKWWSPLITGMLFGLVFFFRLQMAFAMLGVGAWLLLQGKTTPRLWLMFVAGGLLSVVFCVAIDHWMYGQWLFTPFNYFRTNILQHAAEKWGVFPWYYYFVMYVQMAIPPVSIVLLILFVLGVARRPRDMFTWLIIPFLLGHFVVGHKEMRFLYPMAIAFIYLAAAGLDEWLMVRPPARWARVVFWMVVVTNCGVLFYRFFAPAQEAMLYFNYLYRYGNQHPVTLVYFDQSPYRLSDVEVNFFKNPSVHLVRIDSTSELNKLLQAPQGRDLLYLSHEITPEATVAASHPQRLYCLFPDWLLRYNINNWQDRSHIWTIYKISK